MGTVIDALEGNRGLYDRTLVVRLADHGEMGLAHGGMREKGYNAYDETIHVPLVVSNPKLFPRAVQTDALASTVDLMPTLAALAGVPDRGAWDFKGRDLGPVIQNAIAHPTNPTATAQDSVLFTTDETIGSRPDSTPLGPIIKQPAHIRCIREAEWKYAMYFDPHHEAAPEYELYDLRSRPARASQHGGAREPLLRRRKGGGDAGQARAEDGRDGHDPALRAAAARPRGRRLGVSAGRAAGGSASAPPPRPSRAAAHEPNSSPAAHRASMFSGRALNGASQPAARRNPRSPTSRMRSRT